MTNHRFRTPRAGRGRSIGAPAKPPRAVAERPGAFAAAAPADRCSGAAFWLIAGLWFVLLFEPQWFLAASGIMAGLKIPLLLYAALVAVLLVGVPNLPVWRRRWTWFAPFLCFLMVAAITVPFAPNGFRARVGVQAVFLAWILIVGTTTVMGTVRRAEFLVLMYALQYAVWGMLGDRSGLVGWHTLLSNFDGFGAYMVIGLGLCSFLVLASEHKWLKRLLLLTVGLCVVGVVASFARGAFLAAVVVGGLIWVRSPRKGVTLGAGVVGVAVLLVAGSLLHGASYWAELATIAEGTSESTGEDRWEMWKVGWHVFLQHPVFGVGSENWGVFAATHFQPGDIGGNYALNPAMLYGRSLHSSYFQILSEHGIAGVITFIWILADFWRRNLELRTDAAGRIWASLGGRLRLRAVSMAMEAAMVGWLASAALYSMAGTHWFYSLLAMNLTVHTAVTRSRAASPRLHGAGRRSPRAGRQGVQVPQLAARR